MNLSDFTAGCFVGAVLIFVWTMCCIISMADPTRPKAEQAARLGAWILGAVIALLGVVSIISMVVD